jgi:uncharacterized repeat protein (TIGR01451 family)/fimbrial isopeptide formation D2 family protein
MSRGLWFAMNARTRRSLTLLWTALFLFSLALQSVQLASPAPIMAAHDEGIFELEGDAEDSGAAGADWENGAEGSLDQFFVGASAEAEGNDTTYFTGGGSKDENDLDEWARTTTDIAPDKDEILDAFAAVYESGGDTWVYFGADKFDDSGDAQIGFWFFQDEVGVSGSDFTGEHTVGDVLILSDFTNGGSVDLICVFEWNPPGTDAITGTDCDQGGNDNLTLVAAGVDCDVADGTFQICAVVNAAVEHAPWTFENKDGSTDFGVGQFYEGGLNLSDMFGGNAPCFSTFMAETRSSQETDAQLKDFALGSLDTCVPPDIETFVQQGGQNVSSINKGESVVDLATFSGTNGEVEGTVEFFVCGPGSSKPDCSNGGTKVGDTKTISDESATSDPFTPTALGWYCFRAEYTPAAGSEYLAGEHTNTTTECFRVIPADVQIVKTPNSGTVSAGTDISFTLSWTNEGEGSATGVVVSDTLPTTNGLDWSISGSTGTGSTCALSAGDVLTCNVGTIAGNPNFPNAAPVNGTVTLTSATTSANCAEINNTGQITSSNDGTDTDPGQVTVICPDVTVAKTPDGGTVQAGATATFTIVVTNLGPGTATGVTLTDNLPAGYTWTLGGADTDDCSINTVPSPDVLSCDFGTLEDDDTRTITLSAPTTGANCAVIPNTAVVDATNEPESANGNNSDPGDIDVLCAVISLEKSADPVGPVSAGDDIGFDIVVSNTGDGIATDVEVTDTLPTDAGTSWSVESVTPSGAASCSILTGVLTCTAETLAPAASFTIHIVSDTTAATCGIVDNTASVTSGNDGSDSDDASVTVLCPDIEVEKTGNGTIDAGGNAVFTITVTNHGPGEAKAVTLEDQLPAGTWTLGGADADDCDISATNLLECDFGDLADDATRTFTVTLTTTADDCGSILNTVTVSADNEPENDQFPNTDNDTITVQCPDLTVVKSGNGPISAGQTATFTITVTNLGPGAAADATLSDQLPAGDWTLGGADAADCEISGTNLLTCDFGTIDAPGEGLDNVRVITVSKTSDAGDCDAIPNTVTVATSNEAEEDTDNNDDDATIVVNCPDIQVVKDGNGPISAGEQAVFTITVTNLGPGTAFDVELTDELPAGTDWTLGGANAASCSIDTSVDPDLLTCDFGTLVDDASRTITLTGETDAEDCGSIPNLAAATASNESDEDLENNEDDATIVVNCPVIVITKTADDPVVSAGDQIGFTVTVTNTGAGSAFAVTVTDTLPSGMTWTINPASPGWSITGGVLSFGPATLAGGASTSAHIIATTDAADCGLVPNTAFLTYSSGSDDDSSEITVECPDITIGKTADNSPIVAGEVASYTITVVNKMGEGVGIARDVTLDDDLPAGIAWSEDSEDCEIVAGHLHCEFGDLDPGDSASVTVSGTTSFADCDDLPNLATTAASNEAEEDTDDNSDDATIIVRCPEIDIDKTADDDLVEPGQTVTFTINVFVADGPVTDAVVTDLLPPGQTYVDGSESSVPGATFAISGDGRTLTWTFASLSDGVQGAPAATITYDVTIDADAGTAPQINDAQICVSELPNCESDDEEVTPQLPDIELIKTAGDAADGEVFATTPGPVTYTYEVTNEGPLALSDVTVTDDAGTPADTSDDYEAACPRTTLAVGESMTCTFTIDVLTDTVNVAVARGVTAEGNPVEDDDDAEVVVLEFGLLIDKTNDAPLEPLELPDGTIVDLPTADEGETVTYTLDYNLVGDPVTDGVITDVLPVGVTYVEDSATDDAQFTFQGYDDATRTLTWTAENVSEDGSVTYQATVDEGAAELVQPLVNIATIDSAETEPDDDDSEIFVPTVPAGATATPRITLPPTDTFATDTPAPSNPGFALMLVLLALAAVVLVVGFVTPVPVSVRERSRR